MGKVLTVPERATLAKKYERIMQMQNAIAFSGKSSMPGFEYAEDGDFYTDHSVIHLGYGEGTFDVFQVQDEADFYNISEYGRGHEEQHCRSTARVPYDFGIKRGCEVVLEYISSQVDKKPRRFVSDRDYNRFLEELPNLGIHISMERLSSIIQNVQNSIEDGRIERIRSYMFPGFERLRMKYRAIFWENQPCLNVDWKVVEKNPVMRLQIIIGNILSLSTTQLYQKGFLTKYAATPLKQEVDALMPYIGRAYMATNTRNMAKESVEIAKKLAPYYYEACKYSATDIASRKLLEDFIRQLIQSIIDRPANPELSERDEEQDEGSCNSTFSHSDLIITLDDETYDKLVERSREGTGESGIMIRREHPKEDPKDPSNTKEDSGSKQNRPDSAEKKTGDQKSAADEETQSEPGETGKGDGQRSLEQRRRDVENKVPGKSVDQNTCGSDGLNEDEIRKQILEEAKQASEHMHAEAEDAISTINSCKQTNHVNEKKQTVVEGGPPIQSSKMKDICTFTEILRQYKCNLSEPPEIERRGKTLNRKNKMYFKSLSSPTVSYQDQGSIDPSLIYQLGMKESNIFKRVGKDYHFDGCGYMLIDNSGSMGSKKRMAACMQAAVIEAWFDGIMPLKITAFDARGSHVTHEVIKDWHERQKQNCCWNFAKQGRYGAGNADAYDIQIASRELLARPERKKLLVVLSDGAPTQTSVEETRASIKEAHRKGITVCGIYFEDGKIGSDAKIFQHMYKEGDAAICCELSQIGPELERVFRKFAKS